MQTRANGRQDFPALTGIRLPLAVWVAWYHLRGNGQVWHDVPLPGAVETIVHQASAALGVFFALSGFLLAFRYSAQTWTSRSLLQYWIARIARIAPMYYLSLLLILPIAWSQFGTEVPIADGVRSLISYVFLLQGWQRLAVDWNTPAWSLTCELFFYTLLPVMIWRLTRISTRSAAFAFLAALAVPAAVRWLGMPTTLKPLVYTGDFLIGVAGAHAYRVLTAGNATSLDGKGYVLYLPAIIAELCLLLTPHSMKWLLRDELLRVANGAIVLGLAFGGGLPARILSSTPAVFGGSISYGIYILHVPILWWLQRYAVFTDAPALTTGLLYLLIMFTAAAVAYRLVELPADALVRRVLGRLLIPGHRPPQHATAVASEEPEHAQTR